jgi:CBS-domain-containing membrane protein
MAKIEGGSQLRLQREQHRETAADLMRPTSLTVRDNATNREALRILTRNKLIEAPVLDAFGQPIGVVSPSDLVAGNHEEHTGCSAGRVRRTSSARVRDVMTPVFFSVRPETPARNVIQEIRALDLHRLFVIADGRGLVGVINCAEWQEDEPCQKNGDSVSEFASGGR